MRMQACLTQRSTTGTRPDFKCRLIASDCDKVRVMKPIQHVIFLADAYEFRWVVRPMMVGAPSKSSPPVSGKGVVCCCEARTDEEDTAGWNRPALRRGADVKALRSTTGFERGIGDLMVGVGVCCNVGVVRKSSYLTKKRKRASNRNKSPVSAHMSSNPAKRHDQQSHGQPSNEYYSSYLPPGR